MTADGGQGERMTLPPTPPTRTWGDTGLAAVLPVPAALPVPTRAAAVAPGPRLGEPEAGPYMALLDRAAARSVPLSALVELTHACNVDCEHCYLDLKPDRAIGALSTDEWRRIFDELAEEGCLFLTLSGGELLVRRDWFELASHARTLGFALRLYTNGTMIDESVADRIASLEPLGVEISLLGGTAATHDAVTRKRGSFERMLRGIRLLVARGIHVLLKSVVMKKNAAEYEAMKALAVALGCDSYFDIEVTPKNDGDRTPTDLTADGEALAAVARDMFAPARALDEARNGAVSDSCEQARHFDREAALADGPCAAGRRTCHIGPTGDLFPCTQWTVPVGNLRVTPLRELWRHSPALAEVRAKTIGDFDVCKTCDLLEVCTPCMALSLLERGVVDGPSPTKCRSAEARAAALGISGRAAGLALEAHPASGLIQLRRSSLRKV
jgi:radical SAM protein with 4Fe4S-binding SPASM domain